MLAIIRPAAKDVEKTNNISHMDLVYDDDAIDFISRYCKVDLAKADYYRRNIVKYNKEIIAEVNKLLSKDLQKKLERVTYQANSISSELDSSFPNRLMSALKRRKTDDVSEISDSLEKLDKVRRLYSKVGILGDVNKNDIELFKNDTKKEDNKTVLNMVSLYIEDSNEELKPYEKLYEKLELFLRLVNSRLRHKKMKACRERGFRIISTVKKTNVDDNSIPVHKLSSGEQHEIILFYKLIFIHDNGSLVLIDEPELSLHISWQNKFIDDIKSIISLKNLSIIIATHSPDIIGNHWTLTQELLGVEE